MASVGILAAGAAHEINNPIAYALSNVQVLGDYVEALDDPDTDVEFVRKDAKELIDETLDGLLRVKDIVRDVQGFARRSHDETNDADINGIIQSTLNMLENQLKYHREVELDLGELPAVSCDAGKISQVFLNIILNASQSIEDKGKIAIHSQRLGDFILVQIADNGPGISEANIDKLFTPFFTTKDVGEGKGLGLYVCYSIIKEHHGDIQVKSCPGRGSTFSITLPIGS